MLWHVSDCMRSLPDDQRCQVGRQELVRELNLHDILMDVFVSPVAWHQEFFDLNLT